MNGVCEDRGYMCRNHHHSHQRGGDAGCLRAEPIVATLRRHLSNHVLFVLDWLYLHRCQCLPRWTLATREGNSVRIDACEGVAGPSEEPFG